LGCRRLGGTVCVTRWPKSPDRATKEINMMCLRRRANSRRGIRGRVTIRVAGNARPNEVGREELLSSNPCRLALRAQTNQEDQCKSNSPQKRSATSKVHCCFC
jgi:hypothetical protein